MRRGNGGVGLRDEAGQDIGHGGEGLRDEAGQGIVSGGRAR